MTRPLAFAAALAFVARLAAAQAPPRHPFTADDWAAMPSASAVAVSPDGSEILYVVTVGASTGPSSRRWHLEQTGRQRRSRARAAGRVFARRVHEGRRVALRHVRSESRAAARGVPARGPRSRQDAVDDGDAAVGDQRGEAVAGRVEVPDRRVPAAARSHEGRAHRHRARRHVALRRQRRRHRRRVVVPGADAGERGRVGERRRVDCGRLVHAQDRPSRRAVVRRRLPGGRRAPRRRDRQLDQRHRVGGRRPHARLPQHHELGRDARPRVDRARVGRHARGSHADARRIGDGAARRRRRPGLGGGRARRAERRGRNSPTAR